MNIQNRIADCWSRTLIVKLGDEGGGGINGPNWVASSWIVGAPASIIFPMPHKIQNDDRLPQHVSGVSG